MGDRSPLIDRMISEERDEAFSTAMSPLPLRDYVGEKGRDLSSVVGEIFAKIDKKSESPIEAILARGLRQYLPVGFDENVGMTLGEAVSIAKSLSSGVAGFQQVVVKITDEHGALVASYRVDFLFAVQCQNGLRLLCVEADGAEYHYADLKQIARDHVRDAHLAAAGIFTVRFTGAQIYADMDECIRTIGTIFRSWSDDECVNG